MTLPRYPAYRDSGVEWLGDVPEHWDTMKIKHFTTSIGGGTPSRDNLDFWGGDIPWVSPKDMKAEVLSDAEERITETGLKGSATNMVDPGHLLVVVRSGILKHTVPIAINRVSVALNQDMKALKPDRLCCDERFLLRWIQGLNRPLLLAWAKQGATVESIESDYLENTPVPLPPIAEQTAIVTFLNCETAKIDALVAEQRTLIELLKEKRQAVISHAVTKGLNPDAPMKDSGVEWLGEVPEHWTTPPLTFRYTSGLGKMLDTARISGDHPVSYLRNVDVQWDRVNLEDLPIMDIKTSEYGRYTVKPGDLMVCEGGEVGRTAIVPHFNGVLGFQKALHRLRASSDAEEPRFMFYTLWWAASRGVFTTEGLSTIAHLTGEQLRRYRLPTPPPQEQSTIAIFLDTETAKIDALMNEAEHAIELFYERRTALISAAVTGKIDVRDRVAQEAA